MPLLWCSISGHGFGHAAQVAPVLNALAPLIPDLRVVLRTTVPAAFFHARLTLPWDYRPARQDIGCVQDGPLKIDVKETWAAHERFHADWDRALASEADLMRTERPDLVLSNISYFALAAAEAAGFRSVALASLAWDEIMCAYAEPNDRGHQAILDRMRRCYALAEVVVRLAPALPLRSFRTAVDVGPILEPRPPEAARLRQTVGATEHERLVLVGFGGISLTALPYDQMERMQGYRFLVDGALPRSFTRIHSVDSLGMRFMTVLASTDLLMTKPGYSTIVEAVDKSKPVVYVRRYNFGDEQTLVDYLHRHGRGVELSMVDFESGRWEASLALACAPRSSGLLPPPPSGTSEAAALLARYLVTPPTA